MVLWHLCPTESSWRGVAQPAAQTRLETWHKDEDIPLSWQHWAKTIPKSFSYKRITCWSFSPNLKVMDFVQLHWHIRLSCCKNQASTISEMPPKYKSMLFLCVQTPIYLWVHMPSTNNLSREQHMELHWIKFNYKLHHHTAIRFDCLKILAPNQE